MKNVYKIKTLMLTFQTLMPSFVKAINEKCLQKTKKSKQLKTITNLNAGFLHVYKKIRGKIQKNEKIFKNAYLNAGFIHKAKKLLRLNLEKFSKV